MAKKKYLKFCLELIFILLLLMGEWKALENRVYLPVHDPDEVAWIFTGYYFNLYFLRFEPFHQDWNDYEAFDHPPLAKYIVGGALFLRGYTIGSLDPKRFLNSIPLSKLGVYFGAVIPEVPNPTIVIPFTRSVIFAFALSSLFLIYISVRILYGALPAFISTSLVVSNTIFNHVSTQILGDPILLFFFTLFMLLCALYLKFQKNIYVVFAFIVSSLAFLTKLNGILLVFVLMTIFLIKNKFSITKQDWKFLITGIIAFLLITVLLNPVFLNTGIKAIGKMIDARLSAFHVYQETYKKVALLSVNQRFVIATQMIFFNYSPFYKFIKVPIELIMFVAGFYYILRRRDLFLMTIFAFLVVIPISILPYNCIKYFLWIYPFTHIIAGLSLNFFKEMLSKKDVQCVKSQDKFFYFSRFMGKFLFKSQKKEISDM